MRPNIIVIVSDDQGPWAMGCAGNSEIRTPNLDRLAATGMRFDRFFCVSPVCSPARASLLTGRIPSQHGIHDWISDGITKGREIDYLGSLTTYSELLAANGYACGFSGKWHLGCSAYPQKGFTRWYAHQKGGGPYYNAPVYHDGEPATEPGYITDVITDHALSFMDEWTSEPRPFYLSVHYTAPHSPWIDNHPPEVVASYDDCPFETIPNEPMHPWTLANTVPDQVRERRRDHLKGYFAAVTAMDTNIGRILDKLEARGLRESTLIFFTSDNGYNVGHHGIWGKGNGTFPLNMYDSSVMVPAIMSQPGVLPQGVVNSNLLSHYDFMPTLLEYVGIDCPEADQLPGVSFLPLLRDEPMTERESLVVYDEYGPVRMIRSRQWKYVHRYPYGPHELYDLEHDPGERHNLIDTPKGAPVVVEMKAQLDQWFERYVNPRVDGAREAVYGKGQMNLAGAAGKGAKAFNDNIR